MYYNEIVIQIQKKLKNVFTDWLHKVAKRGKKIHK